MNARKKLNSVALTVHLLLATLAGWLAESWPVFVVVLIVLIGLSVHAGQIRLHRPKK